MSELEGGLLGYVIGFVLILIYVKFFWNPVPDSEEEIHIKTDYWGS